MGVQQIFKKYLAPGLHCWLYIFYFSSTRLDLYYHAFCDSRPQCGGIIIIYITYNALNIQSNEICLTSSNKIHRIVETINATNKCYGKES